MTLEPFIGIDSKIVCVKPVPLDWNFDIINQEFSRYGTINVIQNRLGYNNAYFEYWISFSSESEALRAYKEFISDSMTVVLCKADDVPRYLDIYRPSIETEQSKTNINTTRNPDPAKWLIVTTHGERGNLFKVKKLINQKIGNVNRPDITRFGRNSFLVYAKTEGQAVMLLNLRLAPGEIIKAVKPHYDFSYAKGVVFNQDMYDLDEKEILEICPDVVWKVFKVPHSSMIILTFVNSHLPSEIIFDREIIKVRPYRPRALQCLNCFGFGHSRKVCTRNKICERCAQPEHGECSSAAVCVNCKGVHRSRDKTCPVFKNEQEALLKSIAEHISIGQAKKLLSKRSYSDAVKLHNSNSVNVHVSRAPYGGGPWAPSVGSPPAHSGGVPLAPSGGAAPALCGGVPPAPSGGAPPASSGEAPPASSCGAAPASSGGAPSASSSGASSAPSGGASKLISGGALTASPPKNQSGSIIDLDEFILEDIESSESSPVITVHRSNDGEEVEAQALRPKRPLPPPSPPLRSQSHDRGPKNKNEGPAQKKSSIISRSTSSENVPGKLLLSRTKIPKIDHKKSLPKSK